MRRFGQGLIIINIAIVAITTVADFSRASAQATPRSLLAVALLDLVAVSVGFCIACVLALLRFPSQPAWLLVPVAFLVPLSVDAVYQAAVGAGPSSPAIGRALLTLGYLVCYFVLRQAPPVAGRPVRAAMEAG